MKTRLITLFIVILLSYNPVRLTAQDGTATTFRMWYDLFFIHTLNSNFKYVIHTNYKHQSDGSWRQLMIRPVIIYTMRDELFLQGGVSFFVSEEGGKNVYEIRPWQGVNLFFPRIGSIYLNNFLRLEERFFLFDHDEENSVSIRARYALTTVIPLNKKQVIDHTVYLWPYVEAFIPIYERGLNPNVERFRFSFGLGYRFNKHIKTEFVYMHEKLKVELDNSFIENQNTMRIILRYSLTNGTKPTGL